MLRKCQYDQKNKKYVVSNNNSPIKSYGIRMVDTGTNGNKEQVTLPIFVEADIRARHRKSSQRPGIPSKITKNLQQMQLIDEIDHRGHILAYSLGGPNEIYNFVPMAKKVNCGPDSLWREIEREISKFLKTHKDGHVEWRFIAHYDIKSKLRPLRPKGFFLQHTRKHSKNVVEHTSDVYCSNLPDYKCYPRS